MSRRNDRRFEYDVKYFRKVLTEVDKGVTMPYSLSAEVLRAKLDFVAQEKESRVGRSALLFLRSKVFSLQSAVSYAVVIVVIMAVAYGFRLNGNIVDGNIILNPRASVQDVSGEVMPEFDRTGEEGSPEADAVFAEKSKDSESAGNSQPYSAVQEQQAVSSSDPVKRQDDGESLGVGGSSKSVILGQDENHVYLYRSNDSADPHKAGFPITLEVIGAADGEPAGTVDIADIIKPTAFYSAPDMICIAGQSESGITYRSYELSVQETDGFLREMVVGFQPGEYIDSHFYDGVLYLATAPEKADTGEMEITVLPDAETDRLCVITATDMWGANTNRIVFSGADKDVSMHDRNIYVSYMTETGKEGALEIGMVQIRLDGTLMEIIPVP